MALVDLLAIEWEEDLKSASSLNAQGRYIAAAASLSGELDAFTVALNEDALAKVGLRETFENVRDNLSASLQERQEQLASWRTTGTNLKEGPAHPDQSPNDLRKRYHLPR